MKPCLGGCMFFFLFVALVYVCMDSNNVAVSI